MMYSLHSRPYLVSGGLIFAVMATACAPLQMYPGNRLSPGSVIGKAEQEAWKLSLLTGKR